MKRQKLYVAHFVTDLHFIEDEYEMFLAESEDAVMREIMKVLGEHLIFCEVRKATWAERRAFKRTHANPCIV